MIKSRMGSEKTLGQILIAKGVISQKQLDLALKIKTYSRTDTLERSSLNSAFLRKKSTEPYIIATNARQSARYSSILNSSPLINYRKH